MRRKVQIGLGTLRAEESEWRCGTPRFRQGRWGGKGRPRSPQEAPKTLLRGPRGSPTGSKRNRRGPNRHPRQPKTAPNDPKNVPRGTRTLELHKYRTNFNTEYNRSRIYLNKEHQKRGRAECRKRLNNKNND